MHLALIPVLPEGPTIDKLGRVGDDAGDLAVPAQSIQAMQIVPMLQKRNTLLQPAVVARTDPSLLSQGSEHGTPFSEETKRLQLTPQ